MTHRQFIEKWNGKKCDKDGQYGGQCMDLANMYVCEVFGCPVAQPSPIAASTAYQSFLNGHPDFVKIETSDVSQFIEGDIVYWDKRINGYAGHVGVFMHTEANGFVAFEQNYPEGNQICHEQGHASNIYVCGVLRHKSLIAKKVKIPNMFSSEKNTRKVIEQVVYTKHPDGIEYAVVYINEDGEKKLRRVVSKPASLALLIREAGIAKRIENWTDYDWSMNTELSEGKDFDFADWIADNPEKALVE